MAFRSFDSIEARPVAPHVGTCDFRARTAPHDGPLAFAQTLVGGCEQTAVSLAARRVDILGTRTLRWRFGYSWGVGALIAIPLDALWPAVVFNAARGCRRAKHVRASVFDRRR